MSISRTGFVPVSPSGLPRVVPGFGAVKSENSVQSDLLVETFNMLVFNTDNPNTTPPEKQDAIAGMLHEKVGSTQPPRLPDILFLQEVHSRPMLQNFLKARGLSDHYRNVAFFDPWRMDEKESDAKAGQAILTRPGITIENQRRLADGVSPKPVGEATLVLEDGHKIHAFSVHTRYTQWSPDKKEYRKAYRLASSIRLAQMEHLQARIREILKEEPDADIIVAGDFNTPGASEQRRIGKVLSEVGLKRLRLPDVKYTHLWRNEHLGKLYQAMDLIFYRPGKRLRPTREGGIISDNGEPVSYKSHEPGRGLMKKDASDHYPVWTRFQVLA